MKMTPRQLRTYIDEMRIQHLRLKHEIEETEFELEQNQCQECRWRLESELEFMYEMNDQSNELPEVLSSLEEHLAEDEYMNGWKGEDRVIEF